METLVKYFQDYQNWSNEIWEFRDRRVDGWFGMDSFWPTLLTVAIYVYIVTIWGPRFMKERPAYNINTFLIVYNGAQVILSAYIFIQLLRAGWLFQYSFRCQPVDYSTSPQAMLMVHCCHVYWLSKFTEFVDTFCFVARKKFNQVSLLHVVHHGIMPMSVWPGARYFAGGHASFFGLLNVFVHVVMYFYYMMAAMGPQYRKYLWWKQHLTTLQMVQFIGVMAHGFQLVLYDDCDFPWQFSLYIGAHGVLFFILFSQFYVKEYFNKASKKAQDANGNIKQKAA